MKAKELRELTDNELVARLAELKSELLNLRFSHATRQLNNPLQLTNCKRNIARIKTVIRQRELAGK